MADRWHCDLERPLADVIDNSSKAKLLATDQKHWKDSEEVLLFLIALPIWTVWKMFLNETYGRKRS